MYIYFFYMSRDAGSNFIYPTEDEEPPPLVEEPEEDDAEGESEDEEPPPTRLNWPLHSLLHF